MPVSASPFHDPGKDGSPRVLVLTPDYPPSRGGIQLTMSRLVANLHAAEVRVVALGPESPRSIRNSGDVVRVPSAGGRRHRIGVARLNAVGVAHGFRFRPDVVISGHAVVAPAAAVIRRSLESKVIQYLHADEARHRPGLVSSALRRADAVVAVSRHTRKIALEAGANADRVHVVHPGVDTPATGVAHRNEVPTVVTVSRLRETYKGHDVMIRALPLIRSRIPGVRWVVIGDGPLRNWLEHLAEAQGVSDAVLFLGQIPDSDRDEWLLKSNVFSMPSRTPGDGIGGEGFGIAYLEASARGLPVVAGAAGGAADAVVDGETGRLVDARDHVAVAAAIGDLLADTDLAENLGRAGMRRAAAFTWQRHAAAVEALIFEMSSPSTNEEGGISARVRHLRR